MVFAAGSVAERVEGLSGGWCCCMWWCESARCNVVRPKQSQGDLRLTLSLWCLGSTWSPSFVPYLRPLIRQLASVTRKLPSTGQAVYLLLVPPSTAPQ